MNLRSLIFPFLFPWQRIRYLSNVTRFKNIRKSAAPISNGDLLITPRGIVLTPALGRSSKCHGTNLPRWGLTSFLTYHYPTYHWFPVLLYSWDCLFIDIPNCINIITTCPHMPFPHLPRNSG